MGALSAKYRPKILIIVSHVPKNTSESPNYTLLEQDLVQHTNRFDIETVALKELVFDMRPNHAKVTAPLRELDVEDFSLVVFRLWSNQPERAAALAAFLEGKGIPYIDHVVPTIGSSKYACAMARWANGLPFPHTLFSSSAKLKAYLESEQPLSYPCIVKAALGRKGEDNYLVETKKELIGILHKSPQTEFVLQQYIPSDCDYRFLVFGSQVALVIKRQSLDSHIHNTSQGADANLVDAADFSDEVIADVKQAVKVERLDMAGVDVVFDKHTNQHYILEVNRAPQINTGVFAEAKTRALAQYLDSTVQRRYYRRKDVGTPLQWAGRHVLADIPGLDISAMPAKIDTGAYNNALHAENIVAENGKLTFEVPWKVDGKVESLRCESDEFSRAEIKNSSGQIMTRYKIPVTLHINGREFATECTLADRGLMKYPLLIGRRLLRGNFLINVELNQERDI